MDNQGQPNFSGLPPQTSGSPANKPANNTAIAVLVVLIIAGGIGIYALRKPLPQEPSPAVSPTSQPEPTSPTQSQVKAVLVAKQQLKFPTIKSETVISQVPADLAIFVPTEITSATTKQISYNDGKRGYVIEYSSPQRLLLFNSTFHNNLINPNSGWSFITGSRTDSYSFSEFKNNSYQVRISETVIAQDTQTILIESLSN